MIYFSAFPIVHAAVARTYSGSSTWTNRAPWAPTRWGWLLNLQVILGLLWKPEKKTFWSLLRQLCCVLCSRFQGSSWTTVCSSWSSCATRRRTWVLTLTTLSRVWSDWRPCTVSIVPFNSCKGTVCVLVVCTCWMLAVCNYSVFSAETFNDLDTDHDKVISLNFFQVWSHIYDVLLCVTHLPQNSSSYN